MITIVSTWRCKCGAQVNLITEGQPMPAVWFPEDCVTSTLVATLEGGTIEVGLMGGEGMVGLSLLFGVEKAIRL